MKIFVKAKAGAREEKVEPPSLKLWQTENKRGAPAEDEWFTVSVKEPAMQGRANEAISKALAKHFKIPNSQVRIVSGLSSKRKVFEILQ